MSVERVFLGWDRPALPLAVDFLHTRYQLGANGWDLSNVVIVVPGRRGARRALELLAERGAGAVMVPPTIVTLGQLPELLYTPHAPLANPLQALLVRAAVLRDASADELRPILVEPPDHDDWSRWVQLAEDLEEIDTAVAAGGMSVVDAARRLDASGIAPDTSRWEVLGALSERYKQSIRTMGLCDRHTARMTAFAENRCATGSDLVLLATADIVPLTASIIRSLASRVISLVHAPSELAGTFDDIGCLLPNVWAERRVDLSDEQIRYVDRASLYGTEVVSTVCQMLTDDRPVSDVTREDESEPIVGLAADQITVGLGDDGDGPQVRRTLEITGCPARLARAEGLLSTGPCTLLDALARFADQERFDDFATLLRHPDIERYLRTKVSHCEGDFAIEWLAEGTSAWLELLDRYANDHLQHRVTERWLGDEHTQTRLQTVYRWVVDLLPEGCTHPRALPQWSEPIAASLRTVYASAEVNSGEPYGKVLSESLGAIGAALRDQAELPTGLPVPHLTFSQAVTFTLGWLRNQLLTPPGGAGAVEILGWLELHLDDAQVMVVCGLNEGVIPAADTGDPLLPDTAKRVLGLSDRRGRYARDAYLLSAIMASRPRTVVVTARRGWDDQPLSPSRLLLADTPDRVAGRIQRFYEAPAQGDVRKPTMWSHATHGQFTIPRPVVRDLPGHLSVTALGDYVTCPYRFYLKHVLRLEAVTDTAVELDGMGFGSLAHEVLSRFGHSNVVAVDDVPAVRRYLFDELATIVEERFSDRCSVAVAVQIEQLRVRLSRFSRWHAEQVTAGWRVMPEYVESTFRREVDVGEGRVVTVVGRIDRIDHHPQEGYRIIDYKTGEQANPPEKLHLAGTRDDRRWVGFQLPMYRWLTKSVVGDKPVELGYMLLPKDTSAVAFAAAPWDADQIAEAIEQAMQVIHRIGAGEFWPPGPPSKYDDGFADICMDQYIERESVIAQSTAIT